MAQQKKTPGWTFLEEGIFLLNQPEATNGLYFPLANEAGMMSAISPRLHGDSKTGQHHFLLPPVSVADLHNTKAARNFWFFLDGCGPWSVTGNTPQQSLASEQESLRLSAGFLWHQIIRENRTLGLKCEVTNLVPDNGDQVELMKVKITNTGDQEITLTPTAAIPIYGRSADNLRDHRHVTSLLQRIDTNQYGVVVAPTLIFDERGHRENQVAYAVLGTEGQGQPPIGFFPVAEEFIGEGGSLEWPQKVVENSNDFCGAGHQVAGYEAIGALRFAPVRLKPEETKTYIIIMAIGRHDTDFEAFARKYGQETAFDHYWQENSRYWLKKLNRLTFQTGEQSRDYWLKWVTLQPILRRIYGCSFLPHHDYGRGGRGWRDLWQDCLALLLIEDADVRHLLLNNFAGVRIDGSNATIIGKNAGEFSADRNNIPRIWSDHGAWPLLTTKLYLDLTGDLAFLLEEQTYFKDHLTHRAQATDEQWSAAAGYQQKDRHGQIYRGTILEHLLLQNVTAFFNVGDHNNIRLEGADWNDALDLAPEKGETVAFTSFYAGNLLELTGLLEALRDRLNLETVELATEMMILFDSLYDQLDYDSVSAKRTLLAKYFDSCQHTVAGTKVRVQIEDLIADLTTKAEWMIQHLHKNEWIKNKKGFAWFNGYYDNDGQRVEGDHPTGVRMTLTGQVFAIMSGVATNEQVQQIIQAADHYLLDEEGGGYRLNTDFQELKLNLGRAFGFAYGHKENGSVFNHMAIMYAYALYKRGFVHQGRFVLDLLYRHCCDFAKSRIYPGIPEYFDAQGRGMYHYLTGSASWFLLTLVTETFGLKGELGDLVIAPKLTKDDFGPNGRVAITTNFAGRKLTVTYENPKRLDYGVYRIGTIKMNGQERQEPASGAQVLIKREVLTQFPADQEIALTVVLAKK